MAVMAGVVTVTESEPKGMPIDLTSAWLMMALVGALVVAGLDEEKKPGATAR